VLKLFTDAAEHIPTIITITAGYFRDAIGFVNRNNGTLWSVKESKHVPWTTPEKTLPLLRRLLTNVAKLVYFSTLDIHDVEQLIPASAIQSLLKAGALVGKLDKWARETMANSKTRHSRRALSQQSNR
jgi:hypothetical protein